jgi:hypothetical protein
MCFDKLFFWKKRPVPVPEPEPAPAPAPKPLTIPYPEERPDYSKTIENTDLNTVMDEWEIKYKVPVEYRGYWKMAIVISLDPNEPAAATWSEQGKRHMRVNPAYLNPGVIAHEQAHNSYALLTREQKAGFSAEYTPLKTSDPLITLLYSKNTYGLTSDVEGHAELYRYLNEFMPQVLKKYYPSLI